MKTSTTHVLERGWVGVITVGLAGWLWVGSVPAGAMAAEDGAGSKVGADLEDAGTKIEEGVRGAMREAQRAVAEATRMGKAMAQGLSAGGPPSALVIAKPGTAAEAVEALTEDLSVMSRILVKAATRPDAETPPWFGNLGVGGRRGVEAMYLEGFGVLFLVAADCPLVAPRKVEGGSEASGTDAVWEEARREVREGKTGPEKRLARVGQRWDPGRSYDPERVETLKADLIQALRHAANLRGVPEHEGVAVTAYGPAPREVGGRPPPAEAGAAGSGSVSGTGPSPDGAVAPAKRNGSTMTLRAKKADVDAFAKGKLSDDEFTKRVSVTLR